MQPHLVGRIEHAILAGHLKAAQVIVTADAHLKVLERHPSLPAFRLPRLVLRAEAINLLQAIGQVQGQIAEAMTHNVLVARVDIVPLVGLDGIVGRNHRTVRNQALGTELGFAQVGALFVLHRAVVVIGSNLGIVERYLAQTEIPTPQVHHGGQALGISLMGTHIALALIPDDAFVGVVPDGTDHGIVHQQRTLIGRVATLNGLPAEVYVRIAFQNLTAEPALHFRAAIRRDNDAYGHAQGFLQRRCKEPGRSTELGRGMHGRHLP